MSIVSTTAPSSASKTTTTTTSITTSSSSKATASSTTSKAANDLVNIEGSISTGKEGPLEMKNKANKRRKTLPHILLVLKNTMQRMMKQDKGRKVCTMLCKASRYNCTSWFVRKKVFFFSDFFSLGNFEPK